MTTTEQATTGLTVTEPVTAEQVFTRFNQAIYQRIARDRLSVIFKGLGQTGLIANYEGALLDVKDQASYEAFIATIPTEKDIAAKVKAEIRTEYVGIEAAVSEVEKRRATALVNPQLDTTNYHTDLMAEVGEKLKIEVKITEGRKAVLEERVLTQIVARAVKEKLASPLVEGCRVGDLVQVIQMTGMNLDDNGSPMTTYFHGGDTADISLQSIGELVTINAGDYFMVRFPKKGKDKTEVEWALHPQEVRPTGVNVYQQHLDQLGGDVTEVAKLVIQEASTRLMPRYLQAAKERINKVFDTERDQVGHSLKRKYRLNDTQMAALVAGKDFEYEVGTVRETVNVGSLFASFVDLAQRALQEQNFGRAVPAPPREVRNSEQLERYVMQAAQETFKKDAPHVAKKVMDGLAQIISKEYDLVFKRPDKFNTEGGALRGALNLILDGNFGVKLRRMCVYHDSDLYSSEPFSPPSEELARVIKIEVGNGCNWGKCTYCTAYANERFFVREFDDFKKHALEVRKRLGPDLAYVQRVFLAGGNIFMLSADKLIKYLDIVNEVFHNQRVENGHYYHGGTGRTEIRRIAAFGRTEGVVRKTQQDLRNLYSHGLKMIYWGMETGSDAVLKYVNKGTTTEQMMEAGEKLARSDIWTSVMIMPGLGGLKYYEDHVKETARVLNTLKPRFITFLTLTEDPVSNYARIMAEEKQRGDNMPLTDEMVVEQMYDIVGLLEQGHKSLVAAYLPPRERVAVNPIEFLGRMEYNERGDILRTLHRYFREDRLPSPLIPVTAFNKRSPLREMAKKAA
jgi:radical SAM superfamily enzyme YgiQ (UPF0313 family)